jgi:DNA polymerase-3 subunit epsilon
LNTRTDEIIAIGAVRIKGRRILTSQRLELLIRPEKAVSADSIRVHRLREQDVAGGLPAPEAGAPAALHRRAPAGGLLPRIRRRHDQPRGAPAAGMGLPQPQIEVSRLYYDHKFRQLPLPAARPGRHRPALCHHHGRPGLPTRDAATR